MIFNQDNSDLVNAINAITPLDTVPTNGSTKGITSDAVYDALNTTTSGTITKLVSTGILDEYKTHCTKKGNMVVISGCIRDMTNNDGASRNYFQIPEGYRPQNTVTVSGFARLETSQSAAYPYAPINIPIPVDITNTGIVNMGLGGGVTVSQVAFFGSYYV